MWDPHNNSISGTLVANHTVADHSSCDRGVYTLGINTMPRKTMTTKNSSGGMVIWVWNDLMPRGVNKVTGLYQLTMNSKAWPTKSCAIVSDREFRCVCLSKYVLLLSLSVCLQVTSCFGNIVLHTADNSPHTIWEASSMPAQNWQTTMTSDTVRSLRVPALSDLVDPSKAVVISLLWPHPRCYFSSSLFSLA